MNKVTIAEWNFDTNVTDANKEATALARDAVSYRAEKKHLYEVARKLQAN